MKEYVYFDLSKEEEGEMFVLPVYINDTKTWDWVYLGEL